MTSTPTDAPAAEPAAPPPPRRWRWRRWALGLALAVVAYGLLGFLLAPRLLRDAIQEQGTKALRRPVSVAGVKVNPFTLSVTILGLEVKDLDAPRLAGWESLHVRLAPWKVLAGDVGVAEIRLTRPYGRVALDAQGRLNVRDLLEGDARPAEATPAKPASTLGVALDRLEIEEARLVFEDRSRDAPFETTLGPLTVRLTDFRTKGGGDSPYAFTGTTESGETFSWSGTVHSEPLRSAGTVSFTGVTLPKYDPYLKAQAPSLFIESGTVSLSTRYALEWGAANRKASLSGLAVQVESLALARRRDRSVALRLPRLEVNGVEVDLLGRVATVAEVKVLDLALEPRREPDGKMALLEMLERPAPTATPTPTPTPTSTSTPAEAPWAWTVKRFAIERGAVSFEDQVPARPVKLALSEISVQLDGLQGRPDVACPFSASLRWGQDGRASAKGTVWPFKARADLALDAAALDLLPLGPYLDGAAPARLAEGRFGMQAKVTFDGAGAAPAWTFGGDVRLDGLALRHPARDEELVRWRALELTGIDAASAGNRAALKVIRLTEPRLRAVVFEDGSTSMGGAPTPPPGAAAAEAKARPAPQPQAARPAAGPAWRTAVGLLQVVRGRATFVDRSVKPAVVLALTDVEARVASLSSDPRVRSTVDVRAKVDGAAPVTVTGTLNPLQALGYTDLVIAAKGVDLTPLDPYAGKHLGYGLQKGKLDLDLAYKVQEKALQAGNVVRLDQLTLGAATDSPDATSVPVRLALALLKDKDGLILLDVPVEGRTDDPEFRFGKVIWRTLLNVLVKVATSPFSALASLVGGDKEDISLLEFAPAEARLDDAARKRVELLAKSLAQRPGLSLELEANADAAVDGAGLRRAALEQRLRRQKLEGQRAAVTQEALAAAVVTPEERPRLVEALFRKAFPPPPAPEKPAPGAAPAAPPTPAEQEARLLEATTFPPEELPALAAARDAAVREALLAAGLDAARVFSVQGGDRARKEGGPRAYFSVK